MSMPFDRILGPPGGPTGKCKFCATRVQVLHHRSHRGDGLLLRGSTQSNVDAGSFAGRPLESEIDSVQLLAGLVGTPLDAW